MAKAATVVTTSDRSRPCRAVIRREARARFTAADRAGSTSQPFAAVNRTSPAVPPATAPPSPRRRRQQGVAGAPAGRPPSGGGEVGRGRGEVDAGKADHLQGPQ